MEIKQINNISVTKFSNAYHIAFFSTFLAIVKKHVVAQLNIPAALVDQFAEQVDAEQTVVNRSRASANTIEMEERDKERDKYFRMVMYKLRAASIDNANDLIPTDVANTIATHFIKVYPLSITDEPLQVQTAKVKGLINDIETMLEAYQSALGIAGDVTKLKNANLLFEQAYITRVNERALVENTKELRVNTERAYVLVSNHLVMNANTTSTDPDDIAAAEKCALAIDETNQMISEYRTKTSGSAPVEPEPETQAQEGSEE